MLEVAASTLACTDPIRNNAEDSLRLTAVRTLMSKPRHAALELKVVHSLLADLADFTKTLSADVTTLQASTFMRLETAYRVLEACKKPGGCSIALTAANTSLPEHLRLSKKEFEKILPDFTTTLMAAATDACNMWNKHVDEARKKLKHGGCTILKCSPLLSGVTRSPCRQSSAATRRRLLCRSEGMAWLHQRA